MRACMMLYTTVRVVVLLSFLEAATCAIYRTAIAFFHRVVYLTWFLIFISRFHTIETVVCRIVVVKFWYITPWLIATRPIVTLV